MSEKPHIQISAETVVKSGAPSLMRVEVEKTRRAGRIGKTSGLFRVPEVIDYDEARGVAVFERITGIQPLRLVLCRGELDSILVGRIGAALAAVHRELTLPSEMIVPLPPEFVAGGGGVFLHGDPSIDNMYQDQGKTTLVIMDWQMTAVHGGRATYGCRYFDLLWFVNTILWNPTLRHLFGDPVRPVARKFMESYYLATGIPFDAEEICGYAERFFAAKLPLRGHGSRKARLYLPRGRFLTRRFIQDLARMPYRG